MTAMITQWGKIDAPVSERPRGGLLDVADIRDLLNGQVDFDFTTLACMDVEAGEFCGPRDPGDPKLTWTPDWSRDTVKFSAYSFLNCGLLTFGWRDGVSDSDERADKSWALAEGKGLERAFMERVLGVAPSVNLVTAYGTPTTAKAAIAILESYAAVNYNGVPTLHLPLAVASAAFEDGLLVWDGAMVRTALGSKVVIGRGYDQYTVSPTGAPPVAGRSWIYVTGEVVIGRIGALVKAPAADVAKNQAYILLEQSYMATVDCLAAGITAPNYGA